MDIKICPAYADTYIVYTITADTSAEATITIM